MNYILKMGFLERILLLLYFPQFKSYESSRFESFFISFYKKEKAIKKQKNNSNFIFPEKIIRNEDKRTSLMIKGIPINITKKEIRNIIEKYGNINYLYIIKDPKNIGNSTSIAFVNVVNYKSIIPLYMNLRNYKFNKNGKIYSIEILYSNVQGKEKLNQYVKKINFQNNNCK